MPEILQVKIAPPMIHDGKVGSITYDQIFLASRIGQQIYPILDSDPMVAVYVLLPRTPEAIEGVDILTGDDYSNEYWGFLYPAWTLGELQRIHALPEEQLVRELGKFDLQLSRGNSR